MNSELTWKKLSSHYIHKGPWATLRSDKCQMPGGHIVEDYYVLEYPNWVNAVALTEDGKIIMVYQYRHAAGIVSLELPGGVVEPSESNEEASGEILVKFRIDQHVPDDSYEEYDYNTVNKASDSDGENGYKVENEGEGQIRTQRR